MQSLLSFLTVCGKIKGKERERERERVFLWFKLDLSGGKILIKQ
jgi:hypothetical protein